MRDQPHFLPRLQLQSLLDLLIAEDYQCMGPQIQSNAIVFKPFSQVTALTQGITDYQDAGHYRLQPYDSPRNFHWNCSAQLLKPYFFQAEQVLWQVEKQQDGQLVFCQTQSHQPKRAFFGVRACDIAALKLQDQHFLHSEFVDDHYAENRRNNLFIAVTCSKAGANCFCHRTSDGPAITDGYDLLLDELNEGFLLQTGSDEGERLCQQLLQTQVLEIASSEQQQQADQSLSQVRQTLFDNDDQRLQSHQSDQSQPPQFKAQQQSQQQSQQQHQQPKHLPFDPELIRQVLMQNLDHPHWQELAETCLSCGNCTSVCPTCFCSSQRDIPELDGSQAQHVRQWDSCFSQGHGYIHGYQVRGKTQLRYQQWLTHKLVNWYEQYGRSGCVGCGRCVTWCPVGIDFTQAAMQICQDNGQISGDRVRGDRVRGDRVSKDREGGHNDN